jgi:activator of HSP90 ATPase
MRSSSVIFLFESAVNRNLCNKERELKIFNRWRLRNYSLINAPSTGLRIKNMDY